MLCLFKEKSERDKARELTKMLIKADDKLVPEFLQALSETNQKHVADVLVGKCLNTFVVLLLSTGLRVWLCRLCFFSLTPKLQSLTWLRDASSKVYQKFGVGCTCNIYPDISPTLL